MAEQSNPTGGNAFPASDRVDAEPRLTLREYYAGQMMAGIIAGYYGNPEAAGFTLKDMAFEAVDAADALIERLEGDA